MTVALSAGSLRGGVLGPCNCPVRGRRKADLMLPGVEERSERSAEVDKVSPIVHGGPCLSGMLEKVDDLCTLSEQSKLCFFSPQHAVSSVWQVHTVVLHHITASVLALFLHF